MSLSSRLKRINTLSTLEATKEPPCSEAHVNTLEAEGLYDIAEDDLALPVLTALADLKEPSPPEGPDIEENYSHIVFIADYALTSSIAKTLDKFLNIRKFDEDSFKNRNLDYLKEVGVNYIWIDLHQKGARDWVRRNIGKNDGYKLISTYAVKQSAWVVDIEKYVDITVSKKNLSSVSYLTLGELISEVRDTAIKLHKPLGCCFDNCYLKIASFKTLTQKTNHPS